MDVFSAIESRRSVREFSGEEVGDDLIEKILDAGRWAPSGLNNQPWRFMVLRREEKNALAKHTKYGRIIKAAPVCIAVFLDKDESYDRTKDVQAVGACIQNMLLAAHALGLGAVWLGEILNQRDKVEEMLETEHELMAVIAVGQPAEAGSSDRKNPGELLI